MDFETNINKISKVTGKEATKEMINKAIINKAADIIRGGKFIVKGFGPDEGKFFIGTAAHLKDGRVTFKYGRGKEGKISEKTPERISADSASIEDFLKWQGGGIDGLS